MPENTSADRTERTEHVAESAAPKERKYAYESQQDSILLPLYRRFVFTPILGLLPESLSPNAMTTMSTASAALSLLLAATLNESPPAMLLAALLVLVYLTLDNLDGAQARRTGRSSPLGEFLDHWLDTLNNGFIVLGACLAVGLPPLLTLVVLSCATLAFFSVQWELKNTGVFRMGRLADIEGNTTVALLYVAVAVAGRELFNLQPVPGLPSIAVLIGCTVAAQALWTLLSALSRVRSDRQDYLAIVAAHVVLIGWSAAGPLPLDVALVIGFFFNPAFTTRCVLGRLLGRSTMLLDWALVVGLSLCAALSFELGSAGAAGALGLLMTVALGLVTLRHFSVAVGQLRDQRVAEAREA